MRVRVSMMRVMAKASVRERARVRERAWVSVMRVMAKARIRERP